MGVLPYKVSPACKESAANLLYKEGVADLVPDHKVGGAERFGQRAYTNHVNVEVEPAVEQQHLLMSYL